MTDEKQKTGAKILNMLQNLHDKIDIIEERQREVSAMVERLEERLDSVKDAAERTEYEVTQLTKEINEISQQMPDLQVIVQDMERRERAYMHQTPAF